MNILLNTFHQNINLVHQKQLKINESHERKFRMKILNWFHLRVWKVSKTNKLIIC